MTKKIIIALIVIIVSVGIIGYFKAVPPAGEVTTNQPKIEVAPEMFDFAEIKYGEIVEHTFTVKNSGQGDLVISKTATSCACTSADIQNKQLAPGEETDLKVTYNTGLMSGSHAKGHQERIIYIKSNDPVNPQVEVMIQAEVMD